MERGHAEDKENNLNSQNNSSQGQSSSSGHHLRTPNHRTPKAEKSPNFFRKQRKELSDIKVKKGDDSCLTPKGRTSSKVTPTKSGLRVGGKPELTLKKDLSARRRGAG